jgi:hypothetical protein
MFVLYRVIDGKTYYFRGFNGVLFTPYLDDALFFDHKLEAVAFVHSNPKELYGFVVRCLSRKINS